MKMTKGHEPMSKKGGMKSHLPASPNNEPEKSRECNGGFSGKNMPGGSKSPRHHVADKMGGI